MGVSAVLVTFNRLELLKESIECLLNQTHILDNIVIFNNNSSDGTDEYLKQINDDRVIFINSSVNLGGAGGFEQGMKLAYKMTNSECFWIMDDDTLPEYNALEKLMIKAKELNYNFGFLCSNVKWWENGEYCGANVPSISEDWLAKSEKGIIKVKNATFVSVLLSRKTIDKIGFPIGEMFIWGDDTEYTTRLSNYSDSYFVCESVVLHKTASSRSTENIFNSEGNRLAFFKYMYRNLLYIYSKYYSKKVYIKELIRFLYVCAKIPFKSKNKRFYRSKIMINGIISSFRFNPKVSYPKDSKE